jgi:hypothetical protein
MKNNRGARSCQSHESKTQSQPKAPFRRSPGSALATLAVILTAITLSNCAGYTSASSTTPASSAGVLAASATTLSFGSVAIGSTAMQSLSVTNTGTAAVNVTQATISGSGFSVMSGSGAATLAAGQSATIQVQFAPPSASAATGSLVVTSNASNPTLTIVLSGTGAGAGTAAGISATPSSVTFGNVADGTSGTQAITLKNTGSANLVVSSDSVTGTGFSVTGFTAQTLTPNSSMTFNAVFAPTSPGAVSGSISVSTNLPTSPTAIALTGTGASPAMSVTPSSVSFGSVADGTNNSQTITIKNTGTVNLVVSSDTATGTGFSVTGFTAQTLTPNSSMTFNAVFAPASAGSVTGSISLSTNVPGSPTAISLSGTGTTATSVLSASPTTLSFGSVNVGNSSSLSTTLTNNGSSNITISRISGATGVFSTSGVSAGTVLTPSQSAALNVAFTPTTSGAAGATITIASNSTTTPSISVSGTGAAGTPSVGLSWTPSSSSDTVGYNVYRGTISGGPYAKLTPSPVASSEDTDSTVSSGQTYYYVVTAVDSSDNESADSNQAVATIP